MKKVLIGGFLGLIGSIWAIVLMLHVQNNLVSSWNGSRFWASAGELGMTLPLIAALAAVVLGMVILGISFFSKD